MAKLVFTVEVKNAEDEDDVRDYYKQLLQVFEGIVSLSAWGFDTPFTTSKVEDSND